VIVKSRDRPVRIAGLAGGRTMTEQHRLQAQQPIDRLNAVLEEWRQAHPAEEMPGRHSGSVTGNAR